MTVNELRRILDVVSDNGNGDHLVQIVINSEEGTSCRVDSTVAIIGDGHVAIDHYEMDHDL